MNFKHYYVFNKNLHNFQNNFNRKKFIVDFTYLFEKLSIKKIIKILLQNFQYIKIQETIFYKYILIINKQSMYNTHIYKYNPLINLHKYFILKFPKLTPNIIVPNYVVFKELNTQINYIKQIINNKHNNIIKKHKLVDSLKSIEYILELYCPKYSINLITPTAGFSLNLQKYNENLYYIEIPIQNLIHNLNIMILSTLSSHILICLKTLNTLTVGGDVLYMDTFYPQSIVTYYYSTLLNSTNMYKSLKSTSIYMYNTILESLIKQYKYQGILLPSFLFELIIKRMVSYVRVSSAGDTSLTCKDIVPNSLINLINQSFIIHGFTGSFYLPIIIGISKISLSCSGLLSSISFQETLKSLSSLVLNNQIDWILDLKAKIIISDLLDAGTGWYKHYNIIT